MTLDPIQMHVIAAIKDVEGRMGGLSCRRNIQRCTWGEIDDIIRAYTNSESCLRVVLVRVDDDEVRVLSDHTYLFRIESETDRRRVARIDDRSDLTIREVLARR